MMTERRSARAAQKLKTRTSNVGQRTLRDLFNKAKPAQEEKEEPVVAIDQGPASSSLTGDPIIIEEHADEAITVDDTSEPLTSTSSRFLIKADSIGHLKNPSKPPPEKLFSIFTRYSSSQQSAASLSSLGTSTQDALDLTGDDCDAHMSEAGPSDSVLTQGSSSFAESAPSSQAVRELSFPILLCSDEQQRASITDVEDMELAPAPLRRKIHVKAQPALLIRKPKALSNATTLNVPFPTSETQHVRGSQSIFPHRPSLQKRTRPLRHEIVTDDINLNFLSNSKCMRCRHDCTSHFLKPMRIPLLADRSKYLDSVIFDHARSHPAISRILENDQIRKDLDHNRAAVSQESWTERWRPRCADEVIGNEHYARYLRDWLRALELQLETKPPTATAIASRSSSQNANLKGKQKARPAQNDSKGAKRPRIVREVKKRRKKRRLDSDDELADFIADSDESEVESAPSIFADEFEEEVDFCNWTLSRLRRKEDERFEKEESTQDSGSTTLNDQEPGGSRIDPPQLNEFSESLTNTILIAGAPGSGKTAAVYACAEELGWEVFEVYPGIGRRNGASIEGLVGEVGKNHLLQNLQGMSSGTTKQESPKKNGLAGFFGKGNGRLPPKLKRTGTEEDPIHIDESRDTPSPHGSTDTEQNNLPPSSDDHPATAPVCGPVRQSLILLEEVDILFADDTGFWASVINLIKECKRPVVITCNDISLVPVAGLPLQSILVFEPCPTPIAVSYLQSIAYAEGFALSQDELIGCYESSHVVDDFDVPEAPLNSRTGRLRVPDLRRALNQLQLDCSGAHSILEKLDAIVETSSQQPVDDGNRSVAQGESESDTNTFRRLCRRAELASFADSNLCRSPRDIPEAFSLDLCEPSGDDEQGHVILFQPFHVSDTRDWLHFYHEDEVIMADALDLSRGGHEVQGDILGSGAVRDRELLRSRKLYQSQMVEALHHLIYPPTPILPQSAVLVDYIPWVRTMVAVDDALEQIAGEANGRTTRNSLRTKHARSIELTADQHRIIAATLFDSTC